VTNLLNLALRSSRPVCPRFGFASSVASVMGSTDDPVSEAIAHDPSAATSLGYSRSKWVAEHICDRANKQTQLRGRVSVFRVGQLSGDSHRGTWNTNEAWPMMLSTVKLTKTLPDLANETLDWLPVDTAATAMLQSMTSAFDDSGSVTDVLHVVNNRHNPSWRQLLQWLRKETTFEIVSPRGWVKQLEDAEEGDRVTHPAFRLLELWRKAYAQEDGNVPVSPKLTFAMEKTMARVPALRSVPPVDEEYILKIWRWIDENM